MTWNTSQIDGPLSIPTLGPPNDEGHREITGYVPGYHLNISPEAYTEALQPFRVDPDPATPFRVFSGAETIFLRFNDEAEARQNLQPHWLD